jgi:hypothetical protein
VQPHRSRRRIVHLAAIPAVVEGAREKPVVVAVVLLQEVAGLVALLPALLCADGDRGGGPACPEELGRDRHGGPSVSGFWARGYWVGARLPNVKILRTSMNCTTPPSETSMNRYGPLDA